MHVRGEVVPFIIASLVISGIIAAVTKACGVSWTRSAIVSGGIGLVLVAYMLYFFRDPERTPPEDANAVLSPADGVLACIKNVDEDKYLNTETVRISIFLSLFDVHVNRSPIAGKSKFLGYFPGKRFFTFEEKSSDYNQHNAILITGDRTKCLLKQIVGPVCRRVVYWPDHDSEVDLKAGDRIGMMKFGSRLDMYFPRGSVDISVEVGEKVRAGETIIAKISEESSNE